MLTWQYSQKGIANQIFGSSSNSHSSHNKASFLKGWKLPVLYIALCTILRNSEDLAVLFWIKRAEVPV